MSIRGASFAFIHFIDENGTFTHTEKSALDIATTFICCEYQSIPISAMTVSRSTLVDIDLLSSHISKAELSTTA